MKGREATIPDQGKLRLPEAVDRLMELYKATDKPDEAGSGGPSERSTPTYFPRRRGMEVVAQGGGSQGRFSTVGVLLDHARYQQNKLFMGFARELGTELLFLPSDSPNPISSSGCGGS